MKFLAALAYSSLAFLLVYSPACQANTGIYDHHHDRASTRLPVYSPTTPDYQTTPGACDTMIVSPRTVVTTVGQNLTFDCTCLTKSEQFHEGNCPEWKQVDDVLHLHRRRYDGSLCRAELTLQNINLKTAKSFTCVADTSSKESTVHLQVIQSSFEGQCQEDGDCSKQYSCRNFKCDCPDEKPLHILSIFGAKCHSVRRLSRSCWNSIQCQATDKNAHCLRDRGNGTVEDGVCVCNSGYEVADGKCVCSDSIYQYVYSFSKRYRTVFYVLMATCSALILIGLIRVCVIYRRGPTRRLGCVVSTNNSDAEPIVTNENENEKPKL